MQSHDSIGIVGLGQIGGSLALALRNTFDLTGFDINDDCCDFAKSIGVSIVGSVEELLTVCDLVFFAVPAGVFKKMLPAIAKTERKELLVIADLCSTKLDIDEAVSRAHFAPDVIRYVGLHPLAGNERPGYFGAEEGLFYDRTIVVSSGSSTNSLEAVNLVELLIDNLGSQALFTNPAVHDRITNFTIHLPHVFAYLTSSFANEVSDSGLLELLSGNSFKDVTRVASSSPRMVASFLYANRELVRHSLTGVQFRVDQIIRALGSPDESGITRLLENFSPNKTELEVSGLSLSLPAHDFDDYRRAVGRFEKERILISELELRENRIEVVGTVSK